MIQRNRPKPTGSMSLFFKGGHKKKVGRRWAKRIKILKNAVISRILQSSPVVKQGTARALKECLRDILANLKILTKRLSVG